VSTPNADPTQEIVHQFDLFILRLANDNLSTTISPRFQTHRTPTFVSPFQPPPCSQH